MTTQPQLSVVVPVFNERDNVAPLVHEITAALRGCAPGDGGAFEIVYVDDHSRDDTLAVLQRLQAEVPELRVLHHERQSGQSTAIRNGVKAARGAWIATLDGDGQNDPADIPKLIAERAKAAPEVKLFAGYLNGRDETGWVNAVMGNTDGGAGLQRKDSGYFLGATYSPGVWSFTAAGYYDRSKNVVEEGDKGRRWAVVGVAEYALSKRTQLYGTVDFNKVSDAASSEIPGGSTQLGAAVGMRHIF